MLEAVQTRYRFDPGRSRFTVQAFAGGLLSFFAHSPTFAVRDYDGALTWDPESTTAGHLDVMARSESLELMDKVRPADRQEIENRMRREVLEVSAYPEIRFESTEISGELIAPKRYRLRIAGQLSLHGVATHERVDTELRLYDDGIRMAGEFPLVLPEYRIRQVTALGGAIQLRDQLRVSFDIVALKEAS
jgi:polyisoprenoid-binding protein YceI